MSEVNYEVLREAYDKVHAEAVHAMSKHPPMHSPHEAYATILEEVDEYWDEVKAQIHNRVAMRKELVQVAAMAIRALHDLNLLEDL